MIERVVRLLMSRRDRRWKTLELGLYPFVPGDTFKLYLAAALLPAAWRLVGRNERLG